MRHLFRGPIRLVRRPIQHWAAVLSLGSMPVVQDHAEFKLELKTAFVSSPAALTHTLAQTLEPALLPGDRSSVHNLVPMQFWSGDRAELGFGQDSSGHLFFVVWRKDVFQTSLREVVDYFLDESYSHIRSETDLIRWKKLRKTLMVPMLAVRDGTQSVKIWHLPSGRSAASTEEMNDVRIGAEPAFIRFGEVSEDSAIRSLN